MGYPTDQDFEEARRNRTPPGKSTVTTPHEPRGCPTPGACSAQPLVDFIRAKAKEHLEQADAWFNDGEGDTDAAAYHWKLANECLQAIGEPPAAPLKSRWDDEE